MKHLKIVRHNKLTYLGAEKKTYKSAKLNYCKPFVQHIKIFPRFKLFRVLFPNRKRPVTNPWGSIKMAKGSNTMETGFGTTRQVHTENVSINPRGLTSPGDPDGVVSNGRGLKGVLLKSYWWEPKWWAILSICRPALVGIIYRVIFFFGWEPHHIWKVASEGFQIQVHIVQKRYILHVNNGTDVLV